MDTKEERKEYVTQQYEWWNVLEADAKVNKFFASYAGFIVAGVK